MVNVDLHPLMALVQSKDDDDDDVDVLADMKERTRPTSSSMS